MNTKIKKAIVLLLTFSVMLSSLAVSAISGDEALFKASSLNLFEKEPDGTTDWSKTITRAEFSHVISVLLGYDNQAIGYSLEDVNDTTPYRNDIYMMIHMGLMIGDGNGHFFPSEDIRLSEAVVVMLRAMGYTPIVEGKQYPEGILSYAASIGLTKNVGIIDNFTRKDFAIMIGNALDIYIMSEDFTTAKDKTYHISDKKFSDVVFGSDGEGSYYYGQGIVLQTAMAFVDVSYQSLNANEVIIDGTLYETGNTAVADMLGMDVRFVAQEKANGRYELISVQKSEKNNIYQFGTEDFLQFDNNTSISYTDERERTKRIRIDNNTRIIRNYDIVIAPTNAIFSADCGEVTVIDNDSDNIAELIMVFSYENGVVNNVSSEVISLKEGFKVHGQRFINLTESSQDVLYYITDEKGAPVGISSIEPGSVISVAVDQTGKIMRIFVRNDAIFAGQITTVGDGKFTIDGEKYLVLSNNQYSLGKQYDFYINFKNDIVDFKLTESDEQEKYGYIISVKSRRKQLRIAMSNQVDFGIETNEEDADNVTQIPMLICQNEQVALYDMEDKIRIDGNKIYCENIEPYIDAGDRIYKITFGQDGKIRSLETPQFKAGSLYQAFTYNIYDKCFATGATAYEGFAINEKSQILCIPTNPASDEDYMVKNVINKEGNTLGYYVRGFDYNKLNKKCGLVVINRDMRYDNVPGVTVASSKVGIVKKIITAVENDEIVTKLSFLVAGEEKEMNLTEAAAKIMPNIGVGDLFTYTENYENQITNILRIQSISSLGGAFSEQSGLASGASEIFGKLIDISYDEVDETTIGLAMEFSINVNGTTMVRNVPQRNKPPIYIYRGSSEIRNGAIEDIIPGTDYVYIFMSNARTISAIVAVK